MTMHMEIGIIVAAKSKQDARDTAESIDLSRLFDYAQEYGQSVPLHSKDGKALIQKYMQYNRDNFLYNLATLKEALSKCTDNQLFQLDTYPGCDFGTDTFRWACHNLGQRGGTNCWLYDENGSELSYPDKIKELTKQKLKKGLSFYIVPVNVHY
jgi:hypothetical protein